MADPSVTLFGPIDTILAPYVTYLVLGLALANLLTRKLATDAYRRQAAEAEELSRHPLHVASTWALVLAALYYMTLQHHAGMVLSVLVLGLFLADFFEFEARRVEFREGEPLERPKGAITASALVVAYTAYQALFFVVAPFWNAVI